MRTQRYPSDLTDEQWALVRPLIPVYPGGRPRTTSMRDVLDAIFYVLRTGCQWGFLPRDFPPKSTVWGYYDQWRHDGTLEAVHDKLRELVRKKEKPGRPRRTASIDSQSVDTSSGGQARGRDNAKKVDGRKRHIVVDSLGLLLAVVVTAASTDDAAAAPAALGQLAGPPLGKLRRVYADSKYHNHALYGWVAANAAYELDIVRRPEGARGWVKLPIRWTVERTFAWLGKCRRLSVDREKSTRSAEAMIRLAMIHVMLNRLHPKEGQAEFCYRKAA
jgi:putative transposase